MKKFLFACALGTLVGPGAWASLRSSNYEIEAAQQTQGSGQASSANYDMAGDIETATTDSALQASSNYAVVQVAAPDVNAAEVVWVYYE